MGHNRAGDKVRKSERRRRREQLRLSRKLAGEGQAPVGPAAKVKGAVKTAAAAVSGFVEGVVSGVREGMAKPKPEKADRPKAEKPKDEKSKAEKPAT